MAERKNRRRVRCLPVSATGSSIRWWPRRNPRWRRESSRMPISSMQAPFSARGSRRSAAVRWYTREARAPARGSARSDRSPRVWCRMIRHDQGGGVDRIWLRHYPKGVPAEIDVDEYASVREVFEESCRKFATQPAFACMGRTITFADLDALSATFGAWLQSIGCTKGTRVALMMPNILQYPICLFGTLRAGCTVVNVNPLYTARELEHQLNDSGAEIIVVVENFARTLQDVIAKTRLRQVVVTSIGELLALKGRIVDLVLRRIKKAVPKWSLPGSISFSRAIREGRKFSLSRVPIGHDDLAFLQYTGGTTGIAKGAMLLHGNIVANMLQARAWVRPVLDGNRREVILTPLPLYHIFSLTANCLVFMSVGGENVLIPNPRDIPRLVKVMRRYRFTAITGVNTLFNALLY